MRAKKLVDNVEVVRGGLRSSQTKKDSAPKVAVSDLACPYLSSDERSKLILANYDVAIRLAWRMLNTWRIRFPSDEVESVTGAALCDAAWRFDPDRGVSFKTFLFYHLRGLLIKEVIKVVELRNVSPLLSEESATYDFEHSQQRLRSGEFDNIHPELLLEKKQVAELCWKACAQLDPLEQEIMIRTFVFDQPLVAIADELGYCRCHVSRVKSRALRRLTKMLKSSSLSPYRIESQDRMFADRRIHEKHELTSQSYTGGRGRRGEKELKHAAVLQAMLRQMAA